jgi:hypothetical protein
MGDEFQGDRVIVCLEQRNLTADNAKATKVNQAQHFENS